MVLLKLAKMRINLESQVMVQVSRQDREGGRFTIQSAYDLDEMRPLRGKDGSSCCVLRCSSEQMCL